MKVPSSIVLSFLVVPVSIWLTSGTDESSRLSRDAPQSSARETKARRDSVVVENSTVKEPRLASVAAARSGTATSGGKHPSPSSSHVTEAGTRETTPTMAVRRASHVHAGKPVSSAPDDPVSNNKPGASGPIIATLSGKVIPKAVEDPGQPVQQPATWVDLGAESTLTPAQQEEVQAAAEALQEQLAASGLDPSSLEYRNLWEKSVADSDRIFRQRYGGQAWMAHHIQAFHLSQAAAAP